MEVGAVKQAFNNEVILLKKKLNQAKIQIIHKLTRKAKTLAEKKAPEKLKAKFNKKAESAVKEVLIIKKIKPRDIAKFIVTHKGQLNEYLNKPIVNEDKACARLLLHKALQDKYKIIRERFSNISIEDLLMSRQERRKLKKEAREKQNNNKKDKKVNGQVQEGDWDIEDTQMSDIQVRNSSDDDSESSYDEDDEIDVKSKEFDDSDEHEHVTDESNSDNNEVGDIDPKSNKVTNSGDVDDSEAESTLSDNRAKSDDYDVSCNNKDADNNAGAFVKISPVLLKKNTNNKNVIELELSKTNKDKSNTLQKQVNKISENISKEINKTNEGVRNKLLKEKQKGSTKNKNLENKILLKKFNKEKGEMLVQENKVVDPFFITATGGNYMSVAEPRQPDEVKEVHKQGNRKYRRAVMFGHIPKAKVRRDNTILGSDNTKFSKFNDSSGKFVKNNNRSNGFEKSDSNRSDNRRKDDKFNDRNNYSKKNVSDEAKPEKLHPSWEAKKRQSGILPFQGKKIVFDEG